MRSTTDFSRVIGIHAIKIARQPDYARHAETAMTPSHRRVSAIFDADQRAYSQRSLDGVEDFAPGDFFTAADDFAVVRVCL